MTPELESYEAGDDPICELCGNTYEPHEQDRGQCALCEEFADLEDFFY